MKRELKGKYLLAAFITLIIFLLGMFLGMVIEGKRTEMMGDSAQEQKLSYGSLQLQYQMISEFGQKGNCPAITATFEEYVKELVKAE
ncbi:hypothetical protein KY308_04100, partial [Candidatus Woesearchaeota archaeon]|nr:hypothetical protein [Candidatus Woesearchaeota archaeon]